MRGREVNLGKKFGTHQSEALTASLIMEEKNEWLLKVIKFKISKIYKTKKYPFHCLNENILMEPCFIQRGFTSENSVFSKSAKTYIPPSFCFEPYYI